MSHRIELTKPRNLDCGGLCHFRDLKPRTHVPYDGIMGQPMFIRLLSLHQQIFSSLSLGQQSFYFSNSPFFTLIILFNY